LLLISILFALFTSSSKNCMSMLIYYYFYVPNIFYHYSQQLSRYSYVLPKCNHSSGCVLENLQNINTEIFVFQLILAWTDKTGWFNDFSVNFWWMKSIFKVLQFYKSHGSSKNHYGTSNSVLLWWKKRRCGDVKKLYTAWLTSQCNK
jgi:hypothetical protein